MANATERITVPVTTEDEQLLEGLIEQLAKSTAQASTAIDDALGFVEASNERIAAMEAGRAH